MQDYVVAATFDKIQSFLYYTIHANKQGSQSDDMSLRKIIAASDLISKTFFKRLGLNEEPGLFSGQVKDVLLKCSGMCVFIVSLTEDQVIQKLDSLFRDYYLEQEGQLLLKYVCFEYANERSDNDKLKAIKKAKEELKKAECLNTLIRRNQDLLFNFQVEKPNNDLQSYKDDKNIFAKNMNELNLLIEKENKDFNESSNTHTSETYFRTVIIKADLDGMGALFQGLNDYIVYRKISRILDKKISIKFLHYLVKNKKIKSKDTDFKLFPIYIAGDDILFAVPISYLSYGIDICFDMLKAINYEIMKDQQCKELLGQKLLTISIGAELSFNHEPIRYYYERVEKQLEQAKKGVSGYAKICINNRVFLKDVNNITQKAKQSCEDYWSYFLKSLKISEQASKYGMNVHYYLHSLLSKLLYVKGSTNIKYGNIILYHLIPQYLDSPEESLKRSEMLLIKKIIEQVRRKHIYKDKEQWELCFDQAHIDKLIKLLQLLLIFSDERFQLKQDVAKVGNKKDIEDLDSIKTVLFNQPLRFLYNKALYYLLPGRSEKEKQKKQGMRSIFVKRAWYKPNEKKKPVEVYQTLPLSSSLFHRMKQTDLDITLCANMMISTMNDDITIDIYNTICEERKAQHQAPPNLYFDGEKFKKVAGKSKLWTKDYLDTIYLLYRYNENFIHFKVNNSEKQMNVSSKIKQNKRKKYGKNKFRN